MEEKNKNILKEFAEQYHFDWRILGITGVRGSEKVNGTQEEKP